MEDITNVGLTVPNLEYHNVTWTWLDLLLAMKNDSRKVLLSQVGSCGLIIRAIIKFSLLISTGHQSKIKDEIPTVPDRRETARRRRKDSDNIWTSTRKRRVQELEQIKIK